ncbi:DUF7503 family protein [Halostella salina]|nr:hypothetical protein [Halostella salina]
MSDNSSLKAYLADHPRMIGALFTLVLIASQAGTAAANGAQAVSGP